MSTFIIVRKGIHWAGDEKVLNALYRFNRLTGKAATAQADIVAFEGSQEDIDNIQINDLGDIIHSKNLKKISIN